MNIRSVSLISSINTNNRVKIHIIPAFFALIMNGTEFDQLIAFVTTVEQGGFTAAGVALRKDGTIMSRRVSALEKRLGIRLLERTTRQLSLTEAGEAFYRKTAPTLQSLQDNEQEIISKSHMIQGHLRISLPSTFGRMWITPYIADFIQQYPDLQLEINYEDRYTDIIAESYDAAVRIGDLGDNRLVAKKIAFSKRLLCASQDYLDRFGIPNTPEDLQHHHCLFFTNTNAVKNWHFSYQHKTFIVRSPQSFITNDGYTLTQMVLSGLGIAMVADWLIAPEMYQGKLVTLLNDYPLENAASIHVIHPSYKHVPAKTRAFIDWISTLFANSPWATANP